ncbi:DUF3278 domain-containing protein [Apilactobacillus timberlakei]|nr:DUF3278 domain-containing protein [Apilactobacillus timberlakei]
MHYFGRCKNEGKKESFYVKFTKYLYHVNCDFDEYKRSEVNRIGNNAFMLLIVINSIFLVRNNVIYCIYIFIV